MSSLFDDLSLPDAQVQRMRFMIGKAHAGKAEATMNLFEFLLYDHALSSTEVVEAVHLLSSTYGAA